MAECVEEVVGGLRGGGLVGEEDGEERQKRRRQKWGGGGMMHPPPHLYAVLRDAVEGSVWEEGGKEGEVRAPAIVLRER